MTSALLNWIAFKLYLPLHNYLKWWLWSITHSSWNIEVFLGCKDALGDPGGVYRNLDGLLVKVEPRSLTLAELWGVDEAKPCRSRVTIKLAVLIKHVFLMKWAALIKHAALINHAFLIKCSVLVSHAVLIKCAVLNHACGSN